MRSLLVRWGGVLVRAHRQLVAYRSILQVLHEHGCPFCRFLKEFQAAQLQNRHDSELHRLCNFHAWGLAAVQNVPTAAEAFIHLVDEVEACANGSAGCDICKEMAEQEDLRVREFVSCLGRRDVSEWLHSDAVLCIPHALRLQQRLPLTIAPRIDAIIMHYREQLKEELGRLCHDPGPGKAGWGALGRAAEFLVAQRGVRA